MILSKIFHSFETFTFLFLGLLHLYSYLTGFPSGSAVKNPPAMQETQEM